MSIKVSQQINNDLYLERTRRNHFWVGGQSGQLKIKDLRIGIAGVGGMGSNIAEIFARLGVGYLKITDPDVIERTNINRQVIANEDTVGIKKAIASAAEIRRIAKEIQIEVHTDGINQKNVDQFVENLDIVINEIDVYYIQEQLLLLEAARKKGIPVYTTLVVGLGIHLYKFDPQSSYTPRDFLKPLLENFGVKPLVDRLGDPLPEYLHGEMYQNFLNELQEGNVPIFGASTYLGQSLLAIRALYDAGKLHLKSNIPKTPCLPEFLVLDPLTLELKKAEIKRDETIAS